MKLLIDAQLPRRLARRLGAAGHDAVHTLDLPGGNRTTDAEICAVADREGRVVVTKDADFVASFALERRPAKLLVVSTGNITNAELEGLVVANLEAIVAAFAVHDYVEVSRAALLIHG